jgi:hypothetical protein
VYIVACAAFCLHAEWIGTAPKPTALAPLTAACSFNYDAQYGSSSTVGPVTFVGTTGRSIVPLTAFMSVPSFSAYAYSPPIAYAEMQDSGGADGAFDILFGSFTVAFAFHITDSTFSGMPFLTFLNGPDECAIFRAGCSNACVSLIYIPTCTSITNDNQSQLPLYRSSPSVPMTDWVHGVIVYDATLQMLYVYINGTAFSVVAWNGLPSLPFSPTSVVFASAPHLYVL